MKKTANRRLQDLQLVKSTSAHAQARGSCVSRAERETMFLWKATGRKRGGGNVTVERECAYALPEDAAAGAPGEATSTASPRAGGKFVAGERKQRGWWAEAGKVPPDY